MLLKQKVNSSTHTGWARSFFEKLYFMKIKGKTTCAAE